MCDHGHGGDGGGCAHSAQELPPAAVIEGIRYDMGRAIDLDKVRYLYGIDYGISPGIDSQRGHAQLWTVDSERMG